MHYKTVKGILSAQNGMNIYRGCSHGCIYCDARSKCYSFDHDFEDIEIKENALELLEDALRRKRRPCMISTGAMCDPYLHIEKQVQYTRKSLELIKKYGFGADIQTKSDLILRDTDLLKAINDSTKAVVQMTLTTFDEELCRIVEPNVATTHRRFEVLMKMKAAGIPTVVWLTPILPFINDTRENILGILDYCEAAGVYGIITFGCMGLTLREGDREYYYQKLDEHFPKMKERYCRTYGMAYELPSPRHAELLELFYSECRRRGIESDTWKIFDFLKKFEDKSAGENEQLSFF